jgi:hypothetical protein
LRLGVRWARQIVSVQNKIAEQPFTSDTLHHSEGYVDGLMLQRHSLKDVAPAPHKSAGVFAARYLFAMCGVPVTEQFASVSKSANLPPAHVTSKHQRDLRDRTK